MKILITGGCGFIGTALTSVLLKQNKKHRIIIIDNFSNSSKNFFKKSLEYFTKSKIQNLNIKMIKGDIKNYKLMIKYSKKCDAIIHLAASTGVDTSIKDPKFDFQNNVLATFNVFEACRINDIKKIILATSGAVVGETKPPITEKNLPKPISPYGASKLFYESYGCAYSHSFNISAIALRFSNVYGPGSNFKNSVISKFIKDYMSQNKNEIFGDGTQTRDFIYIDDLIEAIKKSLFAKGLKNEVFQISTNKETKINYVNNLIIKSLNKIGYKNLKTLYKSKRKGDVKKNYSNNLKAIRLLKWKPKMKLKKGIDNTVYYFDNFF